VVFLVMGALLLSFAMLPLIGFEFLPSDDSGMIFVNLDLPVGSALQQTAGVVMEIEELIGKGAYPEIETVFSFIGASGGFFDSLTPEKALIYLTLTGQSERRATTSVVAERLRRDLAEVPGVDITVEDQDMFSGGFGGDAAPINIAVKGDDLEVLQEITAEIARIVEGVAGTREVSSSFAHGRPEVHVRLDRERAAALGISTAQVASAVRTSLAGNVITRYRVGGTEYDVRVRGSESLAVTDLGDLRMLPLLTPYGQSIPLGQVADVEMGTGPQTIIRENQVRTAYVQGQLWERDIGSVMRDVQQQLGGLELPLGFSLEYGGELADIQESYASLGLALALAIILVYMIMAAQFESLLFPFIIMFALPQTLIGILLSLVMTGKALSVPALIGVIMLSGIVVNNGIVLVDYINILRRERGYARDAAIREAGPVRLRPILMTTVTTILGMLPLAMGLGEGSEVQAPMAIVIIGGLAVSTIITLIFVPVIYSLLDDLGLWVKGRLAA
jgi:hydrophobic/amphiphilic exporter-1 (mainly G- bacteria), HAE1 family